MLIHRIVACATSVASFQAPSPSLFPRTRRSSSCSPGNDYIGIDTRRERSLPIFNSPSFDREMDCFADPNDVRYGASDWWHNVRNFHHSTILKETRGPVLAIAVWSFLVSIIHRALPTHRANSMCLGSTPHSLLAGSIGLLLVFRTNSAYQRFVEGRRTWESILNTARDITRFLSCYEADIGFARKARIQRLLAAFPYLLHHHIQPRCLSDGECEKLQHSAHVLQLNEPRPIEFGRKSEVSTRRCFVDKRSLPWCLLPDSVLEKCAQSHNRPLWISDRLALEFTEIKYSDNFSSRERLDMLKQVSKLSEAIGHCERLHNTAVPLNYARHALRSLTVWSFTLPFGLVDTLGLLTGPGCFFIAWLMFGIYQIGHSIEDPFKGSLRLTDMSNSIYRDVMYGDRNAAGMRRESAFRKENERESDWGSLRDAFGLGWTVSAKETMEFHNDRLVLLNP